MNGPRVKELRQLAKDLNIWLVPGSVCERGPEGQLFNTQLVLSPEGELGRARVNEIMAPVLARRGVTAPANRLCNEESGFFLLRRWIPKRPRERIFVFEDSASAAGAIACRLAGNCSAPYFWQALVQGHLNLGRVTCCAHFDCIRVKSWQ
ncbi:hypothetical protein [Pseudarthrobacter sp. NamE5]|uniref:hypothetical protein n=1 Tax=Pseudarthrobacter sp. NamE5 TaxID=2576839 RepID=UPI001F0F95AB|nr:hypothetical protein [Pseudarthrobacter sp. NamE5]